jgi:hypothetical protein
MGNNQLPINSDDLIMRPSGNYTPDHLLKIEMAKPFLNQITLVFEDRNKVVKMWRDLGICCCQVAEGDF